MTFVSNSYPNNIVSGGGGLPVKANWDLSYICSGQVMPL